MKNTHPAFRSTENRVSHPASGRPASGHPANGRSPIAHRTRAHIPSGPPSRVENRRFSRLDKAFPVTLRSEQHGEISAIARNVSEGGMMVEVRSPLPLGTPVAVYFFLPGSQVRVLAHGEVKNHYFFNFSDGKGGVRRLTGMGLRLGSFESEVDLTTGMGIPRLRTVPH